MRVADFGLFDGLQAVDTRNRGLLRSKSHRGEITMAVNLDWIATLTNFHHAVQSIDRSSFSPSRPSSFPADI